MLAVLDRQLWRMRRVGRLTTGLTYTVLIMTVLTVAAVSEAALFGGDIRHPEIAGGAMHMSRRSGPGVSKTRV